MLFRSAHEQAEIATAHLMAAFEAHLELMVMMAFVTWQEKFAGMLVSLDSMWLNVLALTNC